MLHLPPNTKIVIEVSETVLALARETAQRMKESGEEEAVLYDGILLVRGAVEPPHTELRVYAQVRIDSDLYSIVTRLP